MSTIIVDNIVLGNELQPSSISELNFRRIIKEYRQKYTGGMWNNSTSYVWVPGMYVDYTPASNASRIRVYCQIPYVGINSAHAISHWIFYANGTEQGRHSLSGYHLEDSSNHIWEFASWGTNSGRIGYQQRSYANDNHEVRPYSTRYWDGSGSNQNCYGLFWIEEFLGF